MNPRPLPIVLDCTLGFKIPRDRVPSRTWEQCPRVQPCPLHPNSAARQHSAVTV